MVQFVLINVEYIMDQLETTATQIPTIDQLPAIYTRFEKMTASPTIPWDHGVYTSLVQGLIYHAPTLLEQGVSGSIDVFGWNPISTAPKDKVLTLWCVIQAIDDYFVEYGATYDSTRECWVDVDDKPIETLNCIGSPKITHWRYAFAGPNGEVVT